MMDRDGRKRVMLVEDDAPLAEYLTVRLRRGGYDARWARDGLVAMKMLDDVAPHAILLDLAMPNLDGFGVLARLDADDVHRRVPVMVLSARHNAGDIRRAIDMGARDYLSKPFDDAMLLKRLARLMRSAPAMAVQGVAPAPEPAEAEADATAWI